MRASSVHPFTPAKALLYWEVRLGDGDRPSEDRGAIAQWDDTSIAKGGRSRPNDETYVSWADTEIRRS